MSRTKKIVFSGLISGLCIVIMFLTGFIPTLEYTLPALAGILLISIVIEIGYKWALLVYFSVSLLSMFLVPVKESAILFIFFFGYYPTIKSKLENIKSKILEWICKFGIFNISIISLYVVAKHFLGLTELSEDFEMFAQYAEIVMLALGNVIFLIYDIAVTKIITAYIYVFRPKYIKKLK